MPQSKQPTRRGQAWEKNLRQLIRTDHGRGWSVRGMSSRCQITTRWADGTRSSIVTALPWAGTEASKILGLVGRLKELVEQQHLPLSDAYKQLSGGGAVADGEVAWPLVIERFREHKVGSGQVKEITFHRMYSPVLRMVLEAFAAKPAPRTGKALLEALVKIGGGAPGTQGRRLRLQYTAALLRFAVEHCGAPACWSPPPQGLRSMVGRRLDSKQPTTPLQDHQLLRLLAGISDPKWRLAVGLMGCYGLRPVEVWSCRPKAGKLEVTYQKRTSSGSSGNGLVVGLDPAGAPGLSADLLAQLAERGAAALPTLQPSQLRSPSGPMKRHLQKLPVWRELVEEVKAEGGALVPYSARHGFALRCHQHYELSVRVAAGLMRHTTQIHTSTYGAWCDEDTIEAAVARATARLAVEAAVPVVG
jgi:integrase